MPKGRPRIYSEEEKIFNLLLNRYPDFNTEIRALQARQYTVQSIKEACEIARKHRVPSKLLPEIASDIARRVAQAKDEGTVAE